MRRLNVIALIAVIVAALHGASFAADLPVPALVKPKAVETPASIPVQQNQPNCTAWTDECVKCTRGAGGAAPACNNIGFACQPKAIRCLGN
ncbi:MAG: hypothetical protein AB1342_05130 [Pseudomonadota bacterium]|jgi:hypothetical protein